ncbi:MAG TPA: hypothetical protein DEB30_04610 [Candidatus Peribacter riflensis]|uniref:Putative S-adenosyl-L-methionine (SAM)-dependent methyltransferase n=1 Tax=Candidatus Peribacter riflensis TaxID=1735162 RepID=A0A0S1SVX3_9BACT|nr:MAG: putative S-adenosyl-L-methionine (SAM)-dependent methyltransferase [Candidatus Peribacter riflensis]OGJ79181.1 MAG: hypothetical protein A2398_03330 [Candidatus Peribacteria bacterium RIFOXYB1_FULL_57_12]ALM11342.1 MAG: putative S-adenosyl-L-methionine (SAM)-dependent methyltransferase [Candidatus Peribacter riflensis]ALM12444.1 MAG: putative S-adenosyl-L-methionine (SAM)-dependent methyltransferase [Candidatus Peribacter riflensis]ALM13545.1 MAG: putative S-adenosyl-L-methionine (SAM)-
MKSFIDKYYRYIRPLRPLYGWIVDTKSRLHCSQRAEEWKQRGFRGAKLDVCGGRNPYNEQEYLNVDMVPFPKVDLAFDITQRFPIEDGVIAEVVSVATLEHLRRAQVDHVLREFFRILAPGGLLQVSTPDVEALARAILDHENIELVNQYLFGKFKSDATEREDLHKWFYPAGQMIGLLQSIGFVSVRQVPMTISLHDPRLNYLIEAVKPS